jgi:2-dehydro-3-deoxyphosphogluconate aldolase/(4S)-4-hydroxy-2-oxoglutarate aldolase
MNINLLDKIKENKVFPIIRNKNPHEIIQISKAIIEGGIDVIEINVGDSDIYSTIEKLSQEAIICAGGVITSVQAQIAINCGAKAISSPIFSTNLVKISKDREIPYIAGITTANEAYRAWQARIPVVKVFPAAALGGVEYIENILRPMPFLNVIPQGDVKLNEVKAYLDTGALAVGVGRNLTAGFSPEEITQRTRQLLSSLR